MAWELAWTLTAQKPELDGFWPRTVACSADGSVIALGGAGDILSGDTGQRGHIYEVEYGSPRLKVVVNPPTLAWNYLVGFRVCVSDDGNTVAFVTYDYVTMIPIAQVYVRSSTGWSLQAELTFPLYNYLGGGSLGYAALSGDGNTLVVTENGSINGSTAAGLMVRKRTGSTWGGVTNVDISGMGAATTRTVAVNYAGTKIILCCVDRTPAAFGVYDYASSWSLSHLRTLGVSSGGLVALAETGAVFIGSGSSPTDVFEYYASGATGGSLTTTFTGLHRVYEEMSCSSDGTYLSISVGGGAYPLLYSISGTTITAEYPTTANGYGPHDGYTYMRSVVSRDGTTVIAHESDMPVGSVLNAGAVWSWKQTTTPEVRGAQPIAAYRYPLRAGVSHKTTDMVPSYGAALNSILTDAFFAADISIVAVSSSQLAALTNSGAGTVTGTAGIGGVQSVVLEALSQSGIAFHTRIGTSTIVLAPLTNSGFTELTPRVGTGAAELGMVIPMGFATAYYTPMSGEQTTTLAQVTSSATGSVLVFTNAGVFLDALTNLGYGSTTNSIHGSSNATLADLLATAEGEVFVIGEQAALLSALTNYGFAGTVTSVEGAADVTLSGISQVATGDVLIDGDATVLLAEAITVGYATTDINGVATVVLLPCTLSSSGTVTVRGQHNATLGEIQVSTDGKVQVVAASSRLLQEIFGNGYGKQPLVTGDIEESVTTKTTQQFVRSAGNSLNVFTEQE